MTYHDLRFTSKVKANPLAVGCLPGLGHKFCIQEETPKREVLGTTFERFNRDVRLRYIFTGKESSLDYDKKIYVKASWIPDPVNKETEKLLANFQSKL